MKVVLSDTGEEISLISTEEYAADVLKWRSAECTHSRRSWKQVRVKNGIQVREQCEFCGELVGSARKQDDTTKSLPQSDPEKLARYRQSLEDELNKVREAHARRQRDKDNSFWRDYNLYLESEEWRSKREKVLRRANFRCEGCFDREAKEVHHLNYHNRGAEFLFELVAVCDYCHKRLHPDDLQEGTS